MDVSLASVDGGFTPYLHPVSDKFFHYGCHWCLQAMASAHYDGAFSVEAKKEGHRSSIESDITGIDQKRIVTQNGNG